MRALHDHAPRGLAEDVGQPRRRDRVGRDQLRERLAGADRGELIGIADEDHVRLGPDRAQQRDEQLEVRHRGLVDDQQIEAQRVVLVMGRSLSGNPAERRVDGGGAHPTGLVHPDRRPAGRSDEQHTSALTGGERRDRLDRCGLAGAGTAGDQRQAVSERVADAVPLFVGEGRVFVEDRIAQAVAAGACDQILDALGQLGLELSGLGAVDPLPLADEV